MKTLRLLCIVSTLLFFCQGPLHAGSTDPLFINLTSDDAHRANMAIGFGKSQLERGHPLTLFLNDKAVSIGSNKNGGTFSAHQTMIAEALTKGATVYICPMCMKHYGVMEKDLLPGLTISNPDLTGAALFKDNTQTLSW